MATARTDIINTHKRKLPVDLTDEELIGFGAKLAEEIKALDDARELHAVQRKAMKDEETLLSAAVGATREIVATRQESREVEVQVEANWTEGIARVVRLDTLQVVETRPLRDDERQIEMSIRAPAEATRRRGKSAAANDAE